MINKPKIDFTFDRANIDLSQARPAKVYSLVCSHCGKHKTIRAKTNMGRRKKYCSKECAKEAFRIYNLKYCADPKYRKKRRQKYWDRVRERMNSNPDE